MQEKHGIVYFAYRLFDITRTMQERNLVLGMIYVMPCKGHFKFGREKLGCFVSISNCDIGRISSAPNFGEVAQGWL